MPTTPPPEPGTPPPWYRQFWPWLLISIPATSVVVGLFTVWIAAREPLSLERDDYYREGLAINRDLARQRAALEQGLSARLQFSPAAQGSRRLTLELTAPALPDQLSLALIHPLSSGRDLATVLYLQQDGTYRGSLAATEGRWYLELSGVNDVPWRLDGEIDFRVSDTAQIPAS